MVFNAYMVMCMYLVFSFIFVWYMYNKHKKVKKWQGERQDLKKIDTEREMQSYKIAYQQEQSILVLVNYEQITYLIFRFLVIWIRLQCIPIKLAPYSTFSNYLLSV